jgi:hypothetical protein
VSERLLESAESRLVGRFDVHRRTGIRNLDRPDDLPGALNTIEAFQSDDLAVVVLDADLLVLHGRDFGLVAVFVLRKKPILHSSEFRAAAA